MRLLALSLFTACMWTSSAAAQPVLRAEAGVIADLVTLGDLIEGAGAAGSVAVFRAPEPGQTGDVPAETVRRLALSHGLGKIETGTTENVAVTRLSRAVEPDEIEKLVEVTLGERLTSRDGELRVALDRADRILHFSANATGAAALTGLSWSPQSTRFTGQIAIARTDGSVERRQITGSAVETRAVLVPVRDLQRGEIIAARDVEIVHRPLAEVTGQSLAEASAAIGQQARRTLRTGQALRAGDVELPVLVRRGEPVTMVHVSGALTLTLRGEAQRDGVHGETVPVINLQTRRVLQAEVTGRGQVAIQPARVVAAASRSDMK